MSLTSIDTDFMLASPPLVSPTVIVAVAVVVLALAFFTKILSFKAAAAATLSTAALTAVNVGLSLLLRLASYYVISIAVTSIVTGLILFAETQIKALKGPTTSFATAVADMTKDFYHHIWSGRTQMEAENEVQILGDHYRIACENVTKTNAAINTLELKVAPMGRNAERTAIEAQLVTLKADLDRFTQVQLHCKGTYAAVQAAYEDAKNNDVFAEHTSLDDFLAMGLNLKGAGSARGQHVIKTTYGQKTFDVIMAAVRAAGPAAAAAQEGTTALARHRATSVARS